MFSKRFEGKNLIAADIFFASLEVVLDDKVFILAFLFSKLFDDKTPGLLRIPADF